MTIEQLIILAIIQGLTEFLPISSSAHLILVPIVSGWPDQGPLMDVAVHLGSLFAVMLYFRRDVAGLFTGLAHTALGRSSFERRLLGFLIIGTLPTLLVGYGLFITGFIDHLRSTTVIASTTIIFGVVLYISDHYARQYRDLSSLTWTHAVLIGLAQCLALVPGTSRSGITLTMARSLGFKRTEAARYSMLLALPTIAAFGLYTALELYQMGNSVLQKDALIVAFMAFASAYMAIAFFMKLLEHISLLPFVLYRLALGFGLLAFTYF